MNIQKPQDIEKIAKDFQYKYIELQSNDGRKLAHYNNTPAKLTVGVIGTFPYPKPPRRSLASLFIFT